MLIVGNRIESLKGLDGNISEVVLSDKGDMPKVIVLVAFYVI